LIGQSIEEVLNKILGSARAAFDGALATHTLADVLRQVAEGAVEKTSSKATPLA
jgi:hypothetical protein